MMLLPCVTTLLMYLPLVTYTHYITLSSLSFYTLSSMHSCQYTLYPGIASVMSQLDDMMLGLKGPGLGPKAQKHKAKG